MRVRRNVWEWRIVEVRKSIHGELVGIWWFREEIKTVSKLPVMGLSAAPGVGSTGRFKRIKKQGVALLCSQPQETLLHVRITDPGQSASGESQAQLFTSGGCCLHSSIAQGHITRCFTTVWITSCEPLTGHSLFMFMFLTPLSSDFTYIIHTN